MPQGKRQDLAKNEHQRWRFKNLQEDGQQPNTMHLRRAEGLPDKQYPVRNKRDVWFVNTKPDHNAHFAVYPEDLIKPCILAGCPRGGIVLDPFIGSGTTARVARTYNRNFIGYELNPETNRCRKIKTNTGADYELAEAEYNQTTSFIALYAIITLIVLGLGYVIFQFRHEIKKFFDKVFR